MTREATVYLVDDEPRMLVALRRLLRAQGFQVQAFCAANDFLAAPRTTAPACLVLDVEMPGQDGLDLQQQLVRDGINVPIVFLTGHGDESMRRRAMQAGAVDFLTKPVNAAELFSALRRALQQAQ